LDNEQLLTFMAVYKYNNYSRAADQLNLTQPAVTARINKLELELDCKLFNRDGKKITLTEEGTAFLPFAKKILNYIEEAKNAIDFLKTPTLTIGLSPAFSVSIILQLLSILRENTELNIDLVDANDSIEISDMISKGIIDIGLVRDVISFANLNHQFLFQENLLFVVGKDHPFVDKTEITMEDLHNQTMICYRRETPLWSQIDEKLVGVHNLNRIEVGSFEMVKQMVKKNWGFSIIPELTLGNDRASIQNDFCIIPFPEFQSLTFNITGIFKSNSPKLENIQLFLDYFESTLKKFSSIK
jgi:DNA-binding transcriptional LysR family regulator